MDKLVKNVEMRIDKKYRIQINKGTRNRLALLQKKRMESLRAITQTTNISFFLVKIRFLFRVSLIQRVFLWNFHIVCTEVTNEKSELYMRRKRTTFYHTILQQCTINFPKVDTVNADSKHNASSLETIATSTICSQKQPGLTRRFCKRFQNWIDNRTELISISQIVIWIVVSRSQRSRRC